MSQQSWHIISVLKFPNTYGYRHVPGTAGLWTHDTRPTGFCLCVDDIALKYYTNADRDHFLNALGNHYKCHIDHQENNYMGLTLDWQYKKRICGCYHARLYS